MYLKIKDIPDYIRSFIKILITNTFLVIFFVVVVELIFGYWFDKENFGPYMREHRMKSQKITWSDNNETINYTYKRNYYGFRDDDVHPSKIQAIILGGSTIDEKFKPEKYTITGFINQNLKDNGKSIKIVNAGVWGQTTKGMVQSFNKWLLKIEDFKPKYILIYTGMNDKIYVNNQLDDHLLEDEHDGHLINPNKREAFFDNIKTRSFIYDQLSIFRYKVLSKRKNFVKFDGKIDENYIKNFNFITYSQAEKQFDKKQYKKKINKYLNRIDKINDLSKKLGAVPIFITNITADGFEKRIFLLNTGLVKHCKEKNYLCIDLARKINGNVNLWYDGFHTTKEGSKLFADFITAELLAYMN